MRSYETLTAALADLKSRGYGVDFNLAGNKLVNHEHAISLDPNEFEITEMYRFEGATNPSDEDIVYAIVSKDQSVRGTLTSAFGLYADPLSTEMVKHLSIHKF